MLTGKTNEEKIWNYLVGKGLSAEGAAGLMGNLYAESGLNPQNLQNTYEKKLGYTDATYTAAVDSGKYQNFVHDSAGYGLAQWTYWSRKEGLLAFAQAAGKSIGDLETQLGYLFKELSESYKTVLSTLKTASDVKTASNSVLLNFERPADQSAAVQNKRAGYGQNYYKKYAGKAAQPGNGGNTMSNSSLVNYTKLSPNHSGQRTHAIDRITPHCVVGQCSVETLGNIFMPTSKEASCNYGIGADGRVLLCVEEKNRSWCSSSPENDQRAVTIECASDTTEPYAFKDVVYQKLVALCVDICKRNGKKKLLWLGDKTKTLNYAPKSDEMVLTVHRWFAQKSCPGDWMYARMGDLASKVTAQLGGSTGSTTGGSTGTATAGSFKVGDEVNFTGSTHYTSANAASGKSCKPGKAKITQIYQLGKSKHPYHLVAVSGGGSNVYGWVNEADISGGSTGGKTYTVKAGDNAAAETEDIKAQGYIKEITDAIADAVAATSQTYVDALKNAGEFTLEAQKEALRKSLAACIASISPAAQAFIEQAYGDMTQYLTTKIEAEVRKQKLDTPITLALPVAESETDTTAIAASTAAATAATIAQTAVNQLKSEPTVKAAD